MATAQDNISAKHRHSTHQSAPSPLRKQTRFRALAKGGLVWPLVSIATILVVMFIITFLGLKQIISPALVLITLLILIFSGLFGIAYTIHQIRQQLLKPLDHLRDSPFLRSHLSPSDQVVNPGSSTDLAEDISHLGDELKSLTENMDSKVRTQTQHIASKSRSLEILYEITTSLSTAQNLEELLEQFLDTLMILVDAKAASVRFLTDDGNTRLVASRGLSESVKKQEEMVALNRCLCGQIATHSGLGIQKGIAECNKFLDCAMVEGACSELIVVPLQYRDRILGVYNLFLERPSSELGQDARDLLYSIGKHLGLAVEKSRLDDNSRRLAIMEERNMIGNELHDSLAQSLVSMRLQIKMLGEILHRKDIRSAQNEVRNLRSAVEEAHTSLRELLANFRSSMDDRGLLTAIEDLLLRFKQETGVATFFQNECKQPDISLSPSQEIQIFRIVQEALANVRKHSNACTVRVLMTGGEDKCTILIEDDGMGLPDNPQTGNPGEHLGLSIMRQRAAHLPGEITIESEPGEGTRVSLTFSPNASNAISKITSSE